MSVRIKFLTELERQVLDLRENKKLTFAEISKAVGRTKQGNMCFVYHRARRKREILERKENSASRQNTSDNYSK